MGTLCASISWAKPIWGSIIFWIMGSEHGVGWRAKWSDLDLEEKVKSNNAFDMFSHVFWWRCWMWFPWYDYSVPSVHSILVHSISAQSQYTVSVHSASTLYQYTVSVHGIPNGSMCLCPPMVPYAFAPQWFLMHMIPWTHEPMNPWTHEPVNPWIQESMNPWTHEPMHLWNYEPIGVMGS